jgi:hypothetical protein
MQNFYVPFYAYYKYIFRKEVNPESEKKLFTRIDLDHYVNQLDKPEQKDDYEEETEIKLSKMRLIFLKLKCEIAWYTEQKLKLLKIQVLLKK